MTRIERYDLDCGAPLIVEHLPGARSAALTVLLPVGSAVEPVGRIGATACIDEWIWRGAGDLDARQFSDALDRCGVQRSSQVTSRHLLVNAVLVGQRLGEALPIIASLITSPRLADESFDPVRDLTLQSLRALRDEPQHRIMLMAKARQFPEPFNRSGYGVEEDLLALKPAQARELFLAWCKPGASICSAAGDVNGDALAAQLNESLANWTGSTTPPVPQDSKAGTTEHETSSTAQVHFVVAHQAPAEPDDDSVLERIATAVLSGGMSGRLFTEVRERRSLCYSVHASYAAGKEFGAVFTYAGTTTDRAQETLDVVTAELNRLRTGVQRDEFDRAVTGLKARLVMQGESTSGRAAAMAHDLFNRGRARTLDEISQAIQSVTLDQLNAYLAAHPIRSMTLVSIGPNQLKTPWA